jgi:hypothetical protein
MTPSKEITEMRAAFEAELLKKYDRKPRLYANGKYYGSIETSFEYFQAGAAYQAAQQNESINMASLRLAMDYLSGAMRVLKKPSIFLTSGGNIRAEWQMDKGKFLGVEFVAQPEHFDVVLFSPSGNLTKICTSEEVSEIVEQHDWLKAAQPVQVSDIERGAKAAYEYEVCEDAKAPAWEYYMGKQAYRDLVSAALTAIQANKENRG